MSSIHWLPWSPDAFERARVEAKPVLLSISAAWCRWCHQMDLTSYADPAVERIVSERFVAVRVDADRRPDISERYSLGGLPTTAFLTADGDLAGGGTYVARERLADVLVEVADAFASRRGELDARAAAAVDPAPPPDAAVPSDETLVDTVFASFDPEGGGFGTAPKFPITAPLQLALRLHRETSSPAMRHVVEWTLDAMGWGGLYDEIDGGFFRCAATRDWQRPHEEKLLDVNAALLRIYVDAAHALEVSRYRERALDVLRYVQTTLADPVDGGWAGSQRADSAYYAVRTAGARQVLTPPAIDRALYASWNGAMASALLRSAEVLDEPALAEFAITSLERVLLACYRPGAGVAHCFDGEAQVRDLLEDQIAMAAACLDAHEATGNIVYEMMAEELAHFAIRTMWDDAAGGFFDRAPLQASEEIGLLRQRLKPFVANCEAARLLYRLAGSSGDHDFSTRAAATLAAAAPLAAAQGPLAAHYLLAMRAGS